MSVVLQIKQPGAEYGIKKNNPHIQLRSGKRISTNISGFQSINGKSHMKTSKSNKTFDFGIFLTEIRIKNSKNKKNQKLLENVINNPNLKEDNVINEIISNLSSKEELNQKLTKIINREDLNKNQIKKKLKNLLKKEDQNDLKAIDKIKRETPLENLKNSIKDNLKKEQEIAIIIDNFRVHKSKIIGEICEILNIKLIFLPPYSPHLNPIEQLWRTLKKKLSIIPFTSFKELKEKCNEYFYEYVDNKTFYENWKNKFLYQNPMS